MDVFSDSNIDELYDMLVVERSKSVKDGFSDEEKAYLLLNLAARYQARGKLDKSNRAIGEITSMKPEADLLVSLADEQPSLTPVVFRCCGELEYTEAVGLMNRALDEGDEHAKLFAIEALSRLGKTKNIARRLKKFSFDSTKVFDKALFAVKQNRSRKTARQMLKLLRHENPDVRRKSVEALTSFPGDSVREQIALKLDDRDFGVRNAALNAVSDFDMGPSSVGPLLASRKAHLRWAGLKLLTKIGSNIGAKMALPLLLDKYSHVRKAAWEAVQKLAKPAHECDEQVYDNGKNVFETVVEYRKLKLLRENDRLDTKDEKEKLSIALSAKELKQARKDTKAAQRAVILR